MAIRKKPKNKMREVERAARKRPSAFKKIRNRAIIGALAGTIGASQGPAVSQHYKATQASMQKGAQITQVANQTTSQRLKGIFTKQKPQQQIQVGKRMLSGTDKQGNKHIGKADVALQSAKTYKPTVNMTPQSARTAGKGAAAGAGAGGIWGIFSFFRSKRKYKKKMRDAME